MQINITPKNVAVVTATITVAGRMGWLEFKSRNLAKRAGMATESLIYQMKLLRENGVELSEFDIMALNAIAEKWHDTPMFPSGTPESN